MKLAELKTALVGQFFSENSSGISTSSLPEVYETLGKLLKSDLSALLTAELTEARNEGVSSDPSKGFKKFTDGRQSLLAIVEDDKAIFAAARSGKHVSYVDLTGKDRSEQLGDLAVIKNALKQAKNINDDAYFSITNKD